MRTGRQVQREAKGLFQACLVDGVLEGARVRQVVSRVLETKPRGYLAILQAFQQRVRLDIERRTARVASAVALSAAQQDGIRSALERRHGGSGGLTMQFEAQPGLIGGLRIRVGNDIYDGSVAGRLATLEAGM